MKLIDSHCHLKDFIEAGEIDGILARASDAGVKHLVVIGTNTEDWNINASLARDYENIDYTVGIHPIYAINNCCLDFENFILSKNPPKAIGEIGLDYHFLSNDKNQDEVIFWQKQMFCKQLEIAKKYDLPVAIHSRDAFEDTFNLLISSEIQSDKILFHCYGYSEKEMLLINEFGAYVSFSGIVTYKNASSLRKALKIANKDKLLIETDCPCIAPVPFRGKQNEPAFIFATAEFVADFLKNAHIIDNIFENTICFFDLKINNK